MTYTTTVAKSNRGNYHLSLIVAEYSQRQRLVPICGAPATQRRRRAEDDAPDIAEAIRKWRNTVHADLRCKHCDKKLP